MCLAGMIFIADAGNNRIRNITFNQPPQVTPPANLQLNTYPGLQITGTIGRTYQIQTSPDLPNWTITATLLLTSSPYVRIDEESHQRKEILPLSAAAFPKLPWILCLFAGSTPPQCHELCVSSPVACAIAGRKHNARVSRTPDTISVSFILLAGFLYRRDNQGTCITTESLDQLGKLKPSLDAISPPKEPCR